MLIIKNNILNLLISLQNDNKKETDQYTITNTHAALKKHPQMLEYLLQAIFEATRTEKLHPRVK